jgi:hypothetical protein
MDDPRAARGAGDRLSNPDLKSEQRNRFAPGRDAA